MKLARVRYLKEYQYLKEKTGFRIDSSKKVVAVHLMKGWYLQKLDGSLLQKKGRLILINNMQGITISLNKTSPLLLYVYNI